MFLSIGDRDLGLHSILTRGVPVTQSPQFTLGLTLGVVHAVSLDRGTLVSTIVV